MENIPRDSQDIGGISHLFVSLHQFLLCTLVRFALDLYALLQTGTFAELVDLKKNGRLRSISILSL